MSSPVSVQVDAVTALAGELSAVSAEFAEAPSACRAAAGALESGLGGDVGRRAAQTATAWAELTDLMAQGCAAVAGTLRNPAVNGAITGFRRPDQAGPILTAADMELTGQDMTEIEAAN